MLVVPLGFLGWWGGFIEYQHISSTVCPTDTLRNSIQAQYVFI